VHKIIVIILLYAGILSCTLSPSPVCHQNGEEYKYPPIKKRWFKFYERGLYYLDLECYELALSDFQSAQQRRFEDKRLARSAGMHLLHYFPHRESGLAYYKLEKFELAQSELELSIKQEPTKKARFYLDQVRKRLINQKTKPYLSINYPVDKEIWINDFDIPVSGYTFDNCYISHIFASGKPVWDKYSKKKITFRTNIHLSDGKNDINISAQNLAGLTSDYYFTVHFDRTGPEIFIQEIDNAGKLKILLHDHSKQISLTVNGESIPILNDNIVNYPIPLPYLNENLTIIAEDRAGNKTWAIINSDVFNQNNGDHPELFLYGIKKHVTVFDKDSIVLSGFAKSKNSFIALIVNGKNIIKNKAIISFFSHKLPLKKGLNKINISARDCMNNQVKKTIYVNRATSQAFQLKHRIGVSMTPFTINRMCENYDIKKLELFEHIFYNNLINLQRFRTISRNNTTNSKFLKTTPAHLVLMGEIFVMSMGIEVVINLINTKDERSLIFVDEYNKNNNDLYSLSENLIRDIIEKYPFIQGDIIDQIKDQLIVRFEKGNVLPGNELFIYQLQEEKINNITGESFGADTVVIKNAETINVSNDQCEAKILYYKNENFQNIKNKVSSK